MRCVEIPASVAAPRRYQVQRNGPAVRRSRRQRRWATATTMPAMASAKTGALVRRPNS
jgi:hypothetical protein